MLLPKTYAVTFASAASVSNSIDLGAHYRDLCLLIGTTPSVITDSRVFVQGSVDGTNFYRFVTNQAQTFSAAVDDFTIKSGVSARIIPIHKFNARYIRLETTAVVTDGNSTAFKIIGSTDS